MDIETGLPGGGQKTGVTNTGVAIDLSGLRNDLIKIWSDDDDLWFTFAATDASTTVVISGDSAASKTSLKGDHIAKGAGVKRRVNLKYPFLIVRTAGAGPGTVHYKRVGDVNLA